MCKKFDKLAAEIIDLSDADTFEEAVTEWRLISMHDVQAGRCACGQTVEREFLLENVVTTMAVTVGSTCVKKYMSGNTELVAAVARRIYESKHVQCVDCGVWSCRLRCNPCEAEYRRLRSLRHKCMTPACTRMLNRAGFCANCEYEQELAEQHARDRKWLKIYIALDWGRMNDVEREFVGVSVKQRIVKGTALTERQRAWLARLIIKYRFQQKTVPNTPKPDPNQAYVGDYNFE